MNLYMTRREMLKALGSSAVAGFMPVVNDIDGVVRAGAGVYRWEWLKADDTFRIFDSKARLVVRGKLQPEIVVQAPGGSRRSSPGRVAGYEAGNDSLKVRYEGVNGSARASITVRFGPAAIWFDPVLYQSSTGDDIVELRYFSERESPRLMSHFAVIPGIEDSAAVSPVISATVGLKVTSWLGRGGAPAPGFRQQWGLPVHFFCGFERSPDHIVSGSLSTGLSDAFCCGLAELPAGDLFVHTRHGAHSLIVSLRSDIWHHLRGPGDFTLGAKLVFAFGPDFRSAIRAYFRTLVGAGIIQINPKSAGKEAAILSPQFNMWAEQVYTKKFGSRLDELTLTETYERMRRTGMRPGMFVIDDKWEGTYGKLEHSHERLPHFEEFLARLRKDGLRVGLHSAFMRCEDPAELGLTTSHMLRGVDGLALKSGNNYYFLDFSQPEVQRGLRERARRFVRRYRPDLVKFDFGYELPSLSVAAPLDMNWAGERMFSKGLEIITEAMREENPDVGLMYYSLSPLLSKYIDLHSPDDLWVNPGEYDIEANRRFYFSSLLAEIGMPTYGSGGYDWGAMPQIWFDSVLVGTLGSLQPLGPDERGDTPTPERLAKFNGLSQLVRPISRFRIEVIGDKPVFAATRAAHASSWARYEDDELMAVALRDRGWKEAGVEATAPVVVASREPNGLHHARRIGVVPYGDGELKLKHSGTESQVTVRRHFFGGATESGIATTGDGFLRLPFKELGDSGTPVEWIEITFED